jgi:glycosyltransferase involved in cell wall biosynthesis
MSELPFVSVCTPTFNRRPFIGALVQCFLAQDYPPEKLEWHILDDGSDPIGALLPAKANVHYHYLPKKMSLGAKRNWLHQKANGAIIVYMDDDDYYPPTRVSHAVYMLQTHPKVLCAGSSRMHIYFQDQQQVYQFGPYGKNHATAATLAFWRKILVAPLNCAYDASAALAEEKKFLKNFTLPMVQLDPMKTLLVFAHAHSTCDKRRLLEHMNPDYVRTSPLQVHDFIADVDVRKFYLHDLDQALNNYAAGAVELKPDVVKALAAQEQAQKAQEQEQALAADRQVSIVRGGQQVEITTAELVQLLDRQEADLIRLKKLLQGKDAEIAMLTELCQGALR